MYLVLNRCIGVRKKKLIGPQLKTAQILTKVDSVHFR